MIAGILAVSGMLSACAEQARSQEAVAPQQAPSASTRWLAVESASQSGWLDAPAQVVSSPNDTALVSAPLAARVVRTRVRAGQRVQAGEALVDVVMPELIRAAGALRSAELRLQSWQERRSLLAPLVEKRLARAAELSDVDANIAAIRGERESARATLRAAGESDKRAGAVLDGDGTVALRAPIEGVVVGVTAKVGETREPAAGPLVELVSADADPTVQARFSAAPPEGSSFEWVDATRTLPLVLDAMSPHADERDGSRNGWLHAEGKVSLVAGSLGRVRVVAPADWGIVPAGAVSERSAGSFVMVKTESGSQATRVELIQRSRGEALVKGLSPGALVAADANAIAESRP